MYCIDSAVGIVLLLFSMSSPPFPDVVWSVSSLCELSWFVAVTFDFPGSQMLHHSFGGTPAFLRGLADRHCNSGLSGSDEVILIEGSRGVTGDVSIVGVDGLI